jgi:hypothetical protein
MRYIPSKLGISNFNWTYICVRGSSRKKEKTETLNAKFSPTNEFR